MGAVSVPSRGAIFLNQMSNDESIKSEINVSVPSRGAIFLNTSPAMRSWQEGTRFPSPLGELYFLMKVSVNDKEVTTLFPSPLGELYFLMIRYLA